MNIETHPVSINPNDKEVIQRTRSAAFITMGQGPIKTPEEVAELGNTLTSLILEDIPQSEALIEETVTTYMMGFWHALSIADKFSLNANRRNYFGKLAREIRNEHD